MSAKDRDVIKTPAARRGEILAEQALGAAQANSQAVLFGGDLAVGTTTTRFQVSQTDYSLGQTTLSKALEDNIQVAAGADTAAGQFRKVLVEVNAAGVVSQKIGGIAATQVDAVLPKGDLDKLSLGWIELPASFVVNTTVVTLGMLKKMPYFT